MIENFRDGTPAELAAFFVLDQYTIGDIQAATKSLLENGYDGEYIASVIFDLPSQFNSTEACFEQALLETGLPRLPNIEESIWLAVRYFLSKIVHDPEQAMDYLCNIINLERDWGKTELFQRPDCDAYFAKMKEKFEHAGSKYVAQEWGIEKLYGLYYSLDDYHYNSDKEKLSYEDWIEKIKSLQKEKVIEEAKIVLDRFYTVSPNLPKSLRKVGIFL